MTDIQKVEAHLEKACKLEKLMVATPEGEQKEKFRRQANIYFKSAMKEDGNVDYNDKVI